MKMMSGKSELKFVNGELTNNKQVNDNNVNSQLTTNYSLVKSFAFTLAETLVVMGIIGVVAALTIPNLNQSTGDREKVAKVKKIYSNLNDVFGRATAVYGPFDEWFVNDNNEDKAINKRFGERMVEFMKISKNCKLNSGEGCFSTTTNGGMLANVAGKPEFDFHDDAYKFITADGTSVYIGLGWIVVDIDGPNKGPYEEGKDCFFFEIKNGQIVPSSYLTGTTPKVQMTKWVLENDNLDYLKCPDELDWDTKTSCK